jgi:hypothetical protein
MNYRHKLLAAASAVFFMAGSALAQNAGTVTNHAFAIGKGAGTTGFTSALCTSAQLIVGQSAADPLCKTITGDVTITAAGATAIGAGKVTSTTILNSAVTNDKLANMNAFTFKGNNTGSAAVPTDVDIAALTAKASPAASDLVMISDQAASGAWKKVTLSSISSAGAVVDVNGLAGSVVVPIEPGGRLTLASGAPVMTTDQAGATTIFYAPLNSPYIPIYNGTNVRQFLFTSSTTDAVGLSIALGSNWAASTIYDVFVGLNSSTVTLCTGPAWTNSGAGTSTRSTGAGTTELQLFNGLQTNKNSMTCRFNNTTTFTCAVNQCTYLGSFLTNGSAGQVDFKLGTVATNGGIACVCVWNAYNRVAVSGLVGDSTSTWTYAVSSTWRAANGSATARVNVVRGLNNDALNADYLAIVVPGAATQGVAGVGINATNAFTGRTGFGVSAAGGIQVIGSYNGFPPIGLNFASALEYNSTATSSTWVGNSGTAYIQTGLNYQTTY